MNIYPSSILFCVLSGLILLGLAYYFTFTYITDYLSKAEVLGASWLAALAELYLIWGMGSWTPQMSRVLLWITTVGTGIFCLAAIAGLIHMAYRAFCAERDLEERVKTDHEKSIHARKAFKFICFAIYFVVVFGTFSYAAIWNMKWMIVPLVLALIGKIVEGALTDERELMLRDEELRRNYGNQRAI